MRTRHNAFASPPLPAPTGSVARRAVHAETPPVPASDSDPARSNRLVDAEVASRQQHIARQPAPPQPASVSCAGPLPAAQVPLGAPHAAEAFFLPAPQFADPATARDSPTAAASEPAQPDGKRSNSNAAEGAEAPPADRLAIRAQDRQRGVSGPQRGAARLDVSSTLPPVHAAIEAAVAGAGDVRPKPNAAAGAAGGVSVQHAARRPETRGPPAVVHRSCAGDDAVADAAELAEHACRVRRHDDVAAAQKLVSAAVAGSGCDVPAAAAAAVRAEAEAVAMGQPPADEHQAAASSRRPHDTSSARDPEHADVSAATGRGQRGRPKPHSRRR